MGFMCWSPPVDKVGNSVHGHMDVVLFLTQSCKVNPFVKDWMSNIPRDDATQFGREDVVKVLEEYEQNYSLQTSQTETEDQSSIQMFISGRMGVIDCE
ncbi:hypothetical protein Q8A67_005734 [Cirrhinus molitorella]|uniref:Glutaminase n=1 Tax=Cirrhinus molitorella TaxID=172907 RepID=A0AA88QB71_9TELE|nr:hypothetical protein Q8A67_005734 [Cirrhinus molitorella]